MMLGLTIEKAIIIAVLIGFLFGPERLVKVSQQLGSWIRSSRDWVEHAQHRARTEFGDDVGQWTDLDPRRYDPRRIIRDALTDESKPTVPSEATSDPTSGEDPPALVKRRRSDGHWDLIPVETAAVDAGPD